MVPLIHYVLRGGIHGWDAFTEEPPRGPLFSTLYDQRSGAEEPRSINTSLLRASRQISKEALSLLYENIVFQDNFALTEFLSQVGGNLKRLETVEIEEMYLVGLPDASIESKRQARLLDGYGAPEPQDPYDLSWGPEREVAEFAWRQSKLSQMFASLARVSNLKAITLGQPFLRGQSTYDFC